MMKQIYIFAITSTICAATTVPGKHMREISRSLSKLDRKYAARVEDMMRDCVGSTACKEVYDDMEADIGTVAMGLAAAARVTKVIEAPREGQIISTISSIAGSFNPYFEAFSSIVPLFFGSGQQPGVDDIIELLVDGLNDVDERFDALGSKIADLERVIRREHLVTRLFSSIEDLAQANSRVKDYFSLRSEERMKDLTDYSLVVYNAINTIEMSFKGELAAPELCEYIISVSKVDRRQVYNFLVDLFRRMIQGISDYVLIAKLNGRKDVPTTILEMSGRLHQVSKRIDNCDWAIRKKRWFKQWQKDVEEELGNIKLVKSKPESHLATRISNKLSKKYWWRDWLIVVYRPKGKKSDHYVQNPRLRKYREGPDSWHRTGWKNRYNIYIASVSKNRRKIPFKYDTKRKYTHRDRADALNRQMRGKHCSKRRAPLGGNCNYPIYGVLKFSVKYAVIAPAQRKFLKKIKFRVCKTKRRTIFRIKITNCKIYRYTFFVLG